MTAPANAYVTWQDSGFVIVRRRREISWMCRQS